MEEAVAGAAEEQSGDADGWDVLHAAFRARSVEIEKLLPADYADGHPALPGHCKRAAYAVCVIEVLREQLHENFLAHKAMQLKFDRKLVQLACNIERMQSQYELLLEQQEKIAKERHGRRKTDFQKGLEKQIRCVLQGIGLVEDRLYQLFSDQLEEDESAGAGAGVQVCAYGW